MVKKHNLSEEQDPKTAEKVLGKLSDMLTSGEAVLYLAIQKKPAVTLIPDSIAVTNKRIVFCIPENLGLTTNYITFNWSEVKEVSFKEAFFSSKFITIPKRGENITIDYIPKVQARKLSQFCNEQLEIYKSVSSGPETALLNDNLDEDQTGVSTIKDIEDDLTQKLKKLKILFEKQLISQEEYERKKADILSQL